jgi:hypothetical protein
MQYLQQGFQLLQNNGLDVNPAKYMCALCSAQESVDFLGLRLSAAAISPLHRHVDVVVAAGSAIR